MLTDILAELAAAREGDDGPHNPSGRGVFGGNRSRSGHNTSNGSLATYGSRKNVGRRGSDASRKSVRTPAETGDSLSSDIDL